MKYLKLIFPAIFFYCQLQSQTLIMNEVSNGPAGNQEYVELVVVSNALTYTCTNLTPPCIDIRGWIFDDNSGYHGTGGVASGAVRFSQNPMWACVPLGTIILIYNNGDRNPAIPPDDLSMADGNCTIIAPVNSTLFESNVTTPGAIACSYPATGWTPGGNWNTTLLANAGDCARIVDLNGCEVFSVCWVSNNLNNLIYFNSGGTTGSQNVWYFNGGNPTVQANWSEGSASPSPGDQTPGAANNALNAAYIAQFNNGCMPITPLAISTPTLANASCLCDGSATVNASGSIGGYTYVWYDSNALPIGQTSSTANGLCAGDYKVVATSYIGCKDSINVTILPSGATPTVNINNQTVCVGNSVVLTATPSAIGGSYLWSPGGQTTQTISVSPANTATYSVTYSVVTCIVTNSAVVSVNPLPVIAITTSSPVICSSGQTASLSLSGTTGTYSWSNGDNSSSTTINAPGVYTATVSTPSCGSASTSITIGTSPLPTVSISAPTTTLCAGSSLTFTANASNANYLWDGGATTQTLSVNTSSIVVTTTNACGSAQASQTINIVPIPTVTLSANAISLCSGQSATVQANANTPVTYTWSSGVNTNTVSLNTAGIYTVNASNLCGTASAIVNVTINAVPTLSVSSSSPSICASGQTASLSLLGSTGTYSWSNGGSSSSTTINAPGVYTATVSTPSCGSASTTVTIGTIPLPTVSISVPTTTLCSGSALTFTANSSDANYLWDGGATTQTISVNTSSIVVTTTNTCGSAQATQTVNIIPIPTVSLSSNALTLCSNQSATVQANANTPVTYTWSSGVNTNTVSLNTAGIYTVNASNLCGTASATVNVTINAVPTLSVSSSSPSICASGQTATLSLSGSTGAYSWSNGDNASSTTINAPGVYTATVSTPSCGSASTTVTIGTIPLPTVSISVPTTTLCVGSALTFTANSSDANYLWTGGATTQTVSVNTSSIVVTTTNACGNAQASQTITIIPIPTVTLSANSFSLCASQSATVQANVNTPVTYTWSNGVSTNTVSLNAAGVYTVDVSNACGVVTATVAVIITPLPTINASATQTLLCSGQTSVLSLTGSVGTILWSNGATTATTNVTIGGVYTVTATTACGTAVSSVTIATQVTPTIAISASAPTICSGQTSTITASSNVSNYSWSTGSFNNTTVVNTSGIVTVSVSNNCGVATESINITSGTLPVLTITPSSTLICPNETATLTVAGGSAPYTWSNSSSTGSVVITNGGTVTVSNTTACGTSTAISVVNVTTINANFSANPTSGTVPLVVSFTNNSSGANSFSWNFGNGNLATTQNVNSQTYSAVGVYTVDLTAINGLCTDNYSLIISVLNEEATLIIPNVFTPNGDNSNDVFRVTGKNIIEFNCTIFNRWGLQLYYWDDIRNGWDGTTDNTLVPDGTYFYIINAKDLDYKEIKKQGFLQLFQ